jgi:hypothetical protein
LTVIHSEATGVGAGVGATEEEKNKNGSQSFEATPVAGSLT